jgi:hypothetical protein
MLFDFQEVTVLLKTKLTNRFPVLLLLAITTLAGAEVIPITTTVTARGEAAIVGGNVPAAREEALVDAQRNALEQVLGVSVRAQSAMQDFVLADDAVLSLVSGYVRNTKILSESRHDSILTLEVQCDVAKEIADDEANKLVRNFSCVVGLSTEIDSQKVEDYRLAELLSADLVKAGFDVRDISHTASWPGFEQTVAAALDRQDAEAARRLGRQMLSNVVILGKARLQQREKKQVTGFAGVVGVYIYDCWLEGRAIETESGKIIVQHAAPIKGVQGTGDTPQNAVSDALSKAQKEFFNDLIAQLTIYGGKKSRPITVEIEGIPTLAEFQNLKSRLTNIRFRDSEVSDLGFQADKNSTFRFDYSENINLIALKLDRTPGLTVVQRTGNRVVCKYSQAQ